MQTLTSHPNGVETRTGEPRAVRLILCDEHQWLTFRDDCGHNGRMTKTLYGVIGTEYGKLHDALGGWKLWKSPSSAYRAARAYREARN